MRKHSKEAGLIRRWFTKTTIKPLAAGGGKDRLFASTHHTAKA